MNYDTISVSQSSFRGPKANLLAETYFAKIGHKVLKFWKILPGSYF